MIDSSDLNFDIYEVTKEYNKVTKIGNIITQNHLLDGRCLQVICLNLCNIKLYNNYSLKELDFYWYPSNDHFQNSQASGMNNLDLLKICKH